MEEETDSLPGLEVEAINELTLAARNLRLIRKERMALTKEETEAAATVLALMHKHGITEYRDANFDPPVECSIVAGKEKVKIGMKDDDEEPEEE